MRVACYTRVSTDEQARHGISLDAQRAALLTYAQEHQHTIVDFYTDEGISARKPAIKRPALQRLLQDVDAGRIELILFCKLDRWTRNVREYHKCQEVLERNNVPWRAIEEDYETESAAGRFKVNIMLAVAEDEADRTSERIRFVFEQKRARKEPLTGNCPTGYKLDGKKIVKADNAPAVQAFFDTFLSTHSLWEAREASRANGLTLQYQLAKKMLRSTCYYGRYYEIEGMCDPYITQDQFDTIQALIPRNIKHNSKHIYIFRGLVFCSECGRRMSGKTSKRTRRYYNCVWSYADRSCINRSNLSESVLEHYILERIAPLMESAAAIDTSDDPDAADQIKAEIDALRIKINKLSDLYLNDLITLDDLKLRKAQYETEIAQLDKQLPRRYQIPELSPDWREMYSTLTDAEKQKFWALIIDKIVIHPDRTIDIITK